MLETTVTQHRIQHLMFTNTFQQTINALIRDERLNDDLLFYTAQNHVEILNYPAFAHFNQPKWVIRIIARVPPIPKSKQFTIVKLFNAMYDTAQRYHMNNARRYVSAAICACVQSAGIMAFAADCPQRTPFTSPAEPLLDDRSERLAAELSRLGTLWVAYLLWPFISDAQWRVDHRIGLCAIHATPAPPELRRSEPPVDEEEDMERAMEQLDKLKDDLLMRDNRTCFYSGSLDPEVTQTYPTRIFNIAVALPNDNADPQRGEVCESRAITLDLFKRYCEIDDKDIEIMMDWFNPQNALLLNRSALTFFNLFMWCLRPTDVPNTYEIFIHRKGGPPPKVGNDHVTFVDHSADFIPSPSVEMQDRRGMISLIWPHVLEHRQEGVGTDLPRPSLLRAHATIADVLNLSGAANLFDAFFPFYVKGCVPEANGQSFMRSVVEYEGSALSMDEELFEAAAAIDDVHISEPSRAAS